MEATDFEKWCAGEMGRTVEYIVSQRKPDPCDDYSNGEVNTRYRAYMAGVLSRLPYQTPPKGDEDGMD
ncbi:hypothetical protein ACY19I_12695 [Morganella morganii]